MGFYFEVNNQVYPIFVDSHKAVESETRKNLKSIRTDIEGEYIREFHQYCITQGVCHEQSMPKIP